MQTVISSMRQLRLAAGLFQPVLLVLGVCVILCPRVCPAAQNAWDQVYLSTALFAGVEARPAIPHGAHFRIAGQDLETPRHGPPSSVDQYARLQLDLGSREGMTEKGVGPLVGIRLTIEHDDEFLAGYHHNGQNARIALGTTCIGIGAAISETAVGTRFGVEFARIDYRHLQYTVRAGGQRFADTMRFVGFQPFALHFEHTFHTEQEGARPIVGFNIAGGYGWGHSDSDPMQYNGGSVSMNLGVLSPRPRWRFDFTCSVASRFFRGYEPAPGKPVAASGISELSYTGFGVRLGWVI